MLDCVEFDSNSTQPPLIPRLRKGGEEMQYDAYETNFQYPKTQAETDGPAQWGDAAGNHPMVEVEGEADGMQVPPATLYRGIYR